MARQEGQFLVEDFFVNNGGLNTADSPFIVTPNECTGGQNFDYITRGGVKKRAGHTKLNSVANDQLKSLGFGVWDKPNNARVAIRAAGYKFQNFDTTTFTFTNLSEDTAPSGALTLTITIASPAVLTSSSAHGLVVGDPIQITTSGALPTGLTASTTYYVSAIPSTTTFRLSATLGGADINTSGSQSGTHTLKVINTTFLSGSSLTPVVFSMFNTATNGTLWAAGGGLSGIYGAYSGLKITKNGVDAPGGSIALSTSADASTPDFVSTGYYRYAIAFRKTSTQAISNAALFKEINLTTATDKITIDLTSVTGIDTTKYDKFVVYRSAVSVSAQGDVAFTTGDFVAYVNITATSYDDTGGYILTAQNVPQAGATIDNSTPPSGSAESFKTITTFKRRLVIAKGSTIYLSDLNKDESWPAANIITVPSGGDITALGVISITSPVNSDIDEVLCIFKQSELWVLTGNSTSDWILKFICRVGCPGQAIVVQAEGYLAWINSRGPYIWNGSGKPEFVGMKIRDKFLSGGDIDKSKLPQGWGMYVGKKNQIQWVLSSTINGTQKYVLKYDLNQAGSSVQADALGNRQIDGVFTADVTSMALYGGVSFFVAADSTEETVLMGDDSGFVYSGYSGVAESGANFLFDYYTPYLNLGNPASAKRIAKVVVWVQDAGPYNLGLDFWSNYRYNTNDATTMARAISPNLTDIGSVWGAFTWGASIWGANPMQPRAVVFNLPPANNNSEGDAFRLRFYHTGQKTVLIYGFSIYYSDLSLRK